MYIQSLQHCHWRSSLDEPNHVPGNDRWDDGVLAAAGDAALWNTCSPGTLSASGEQV